MFPNRDLHLQAVRQRAESQQAASTSQKPAVDEASQKVPKKVATGSKLAVKVKSLVKVAKRASNAGQKDGSKRSRREEDKPPDQTDTPVLGSLFSNYGSDSGDEQ